MTFNAYPIQGMCVGLEWDWVNQWFSIDLFVVRCIFNYGKETDASF